MSSLGQDLKKERELRGISLKEIAESTKINLRFLKALEEDQMNLLPGKFFTRGIIRAYSSHLELDVEEILNRYQKIVEDEEQKKKQLREAEEEPSPSRYGFRKAVIYFFLGLAIIAFFLFVSRILRKNPPPQTTTILSPAGVEKTTFPSIKKETTPPQPQFSGLIFELSFHQETWLQVYVDGVLKIDGIKMPGEKINLEVDEEFLMHLGNAGGLTYTINGEEGKIFGKSGQVVKNIRINQDNYTEFLAEDVLSPQANVN